MNINIEKNADKIVDMSDFFKALSDPTRLKIVLTISKGEICVNDIANNIGMTKSAVSHQLSYLKKLRLIKSRKEGKEVYYSLDDDHVNLLINSAWEHVTE
ncbi:MAG: winged helix-turn-helix transcriptional regulator [Acholeplasmatales bacterium]|jgi:ArsR family transcriptional regulator|nr:winged helix-turn-helix transcriptional regulator [Acholeplasmatales bacterium]